MRLARSSGSGRAITLAWARVTAAGEVGRNGQLDRIPDPGMANRGVS